jgi:ubiquinol-cytochrome c reductase cytochrome b subunit
VRGMHFFGASAMVLLVGLHAARVFLTGSYKYPRELLWVSGVVLLVLTMAMAFTGQLLRWTQDSVWAVVVASYFAGRVPVIGPWFGQFLLGGDVVGGATLSRFFAFHVFLLPALIFALVGLHLYMVFHHGISEPPKAGRPVDPKTYRAWYQQLLERHGKPYWPDAAWKEVAGGAGVIVTVVLLAWIFGPPALGAPPDPTALARAPQPDWFLLWYYSLLAVKPRGLEDLTMVYAPLAIVLFLIVLPFIANRGERSPSQRPWAILSVAAVTIVLGTLIGLGYQAPWVPDFETQPLPPQVIGVTSGPVYEGAQLFHTAGCQYCHQVAGRGGRWGPDLTDVSKRIPAEEITVMIVRGTRDMPSYRDSLTLRELDSIVAFLQAMGEQSGQPR